MLNGQILRSIIDSLDYAIIVCDTKGDFLLWNKKAMDTIMLDPEKTTQNEWQSYFGTYYMDKKTPFHSEEFPIIKAAKKGEISKKVRMFVSNSKIPNGMYLEVDAFPIRDNNEKVIAGVASFNDITQNVQMQEIFDEVTDRFQHMRELIEQSLK